MSVKIRKHGKNEYKNGLLDIHLTEGDEVELTQDQFVKMRADIGVVRYRSEIEVIAPARLRSVEDYFKA